MGRYTRGKTTIHLFFLNDHMISLTTTITMSISPQKLKQQVVYWLHLASVMRWIPCPISPKADTSCMFKKQCENAVHRVGHLSLCFIGKNKPLWDYHRNVWVQIFRNFYCDLFSVLFQGPHFCTILLLHNLYTAFRTLLWGRELLLYLFNKWKDETQMAWGAPPQITLLWCPVLQKSFA